MFQQEIQSQPKPESANLRFRSIWISDIHLGLRDCQTRLLLDFLSRTSSEYLYLLGDIIDIWKLRRRAYWPHENNEIVQQFLKKASAGTKVIYLPGNHDEAIRDFDHQQFGNILVIDDIIHQSADNRRFLVLHGDQYDVVIDHAKWLAHAGSTAYAFVMWFNRVFNVVRRKMGFSYWSLSAYLKQKVKRVINNMGHYEAALVQAAREQNAVGLIFGHTHNAGIREMDGIMLLNDGDWVESCTALVEHFDGRFEILRWREIATGA